MSFKQGHESLESYVDNIRVKISERYKPPPRINVAMTYAQRLTLNQQIQDNMPNYEFQLENTVLEKMKEWRNARVTMSEERKDRLVKVREELEKKELERIEQEKLEEVEVKTVDETATVNNKYNSTSNLFAGSSSINHSYNYTSKDGILMPTQVSTNYTNILTPIPLNNCKEQYKCKPDDKSPFNLSDFENDTSSPFDNMELKSINDLEELAQVLKREEPKYQVNPTIYPPYQNVQPANTSQIQTSYTNYPGYSYNIPSSMSYMQPVTSDYPQTNGYYFSDVARQNQNFQSPYLYSKPCTTQYNFTSTQSTPLEETKKSNCKSVPDIMKSLQAELENSHIDNTIPNLSVDNTAYIRDKVAPQTSRPKSTEAVLYPRKKSKEEVDDTFSSLTKKQQELCRSISSMGFPLSRVARICKMLGDDHKKIVEHLLALSDLLDLGFPETDVSSALFQCDNDRDKALDKLIS